MSYQSHQSSSHVTLFESCQSELIELQEKFKNDLLTLKEVEQKFEEWKKRPELEVARCVCVCVQTQFIRSFPNFSGN